LENQLILKVKIIRSDNETEFKNHDLNQFCGMKGIKKKFSVPRTPQQNGIAERKNRTLMILKFSFIITSDYLCGMKGIKREFSVPKTPQQNGIAKRKNRTLIEAVRTMLADSLLTIPI
nr:putative ribonuclease H-like domain-containing protein [Tanacetum cinerariifolium]